MTPEGKIKAKVKKMLDEYKGVATVGLDGDILSGYKLYAHWPVQNGMGSPTLDCIGCYYGIYFAIETKAPGKVPTPRQLTTIEQIKAAGGITFVVSSDEDIEAVRRAFDMIKWSHADNSKQ